MNFTYHFHYETKYTKSWSCPIFYSFHSSETKNEKKNKTKISRDVKMLVKNIEKVEQNRDLGKKMNCLLEKAEKNQDLGKKIIRR